MNRKSNIEPVPVCCCIFTWTYIERGRSSLVNKYVLNHLPSQKKHELTNKKQNQNQKKKNNNYILASINRDDKRKLLLMFVSNMPWHILLGARLSHSLTSVWIGLMHGSGIMNVFIFLCPAIFNKGHLACFYICVFLIFWTENLKQTKD